MSTPMTIQATVSVWDCGATSSYLQTELFRALEKGDEVRIVQYVTFYGSSEMAEFADRQKIGEADITLRLIPRDEQTRMAIKAYQKKLEDLSAAYLTAQQEIMEQISKFQALENTVEA